MKLRSCAFLLLAPIAAFAADSFTVTVTNDLAAARPSETISIPWSEVQKALPHALLQHLAVKDSAGHSLPYQVTNVNPEASDPKRVGIAYGELLFQHDFAAGEKSATFTVERLKEVAPLFPSKVFARYVPERYDDFAWENDRIGHRTYGPALADRNLNHNPREILVTSGIDVWCKRVPYLIVDRWYNKGSDHYHDDEGEGMDMFHVGTTRGCGGTGVWDGNSLAVGRNYHTWKVIANGPIRAIFELGYEVWDGHGVQISEVKRFTVDAGHNLDQIESTFTYLGSKPVTIGIGINKRTADSDQAEKETVTRNDRGQWVSQWEVEKTDGSLGTAIILPESFSGFAEDRDNQLILARVTSGYCLRYYAGAGWTLSGQFASQAEWEAYVAAEAARVQSPLKVAISATP
jgi:hypothetical protein